LLRTSELKEPILTATNQYPNCPIFLDSSRFHIIRETLGINECQPNMGVTITRFRTICTLIQQQMSQQELTSQSYCFLLGLQLKLQHEEFQNPIPQTYDVPEDQLSVERLVWYDDNSSTAIFC